MTNRASLSALLVAVLAIPAVGFAGTPCDLLPTTNKRVVSPSKVEDVLCNVCGSGVPVHGARDQFGDGLDYNDGAKHFECEVHVRNRGNGQCKNQTTCRPGGERFFDNGTYRCRYPEVAVTLPGPSNPRDNCERNLPLSISEVHDDRELKNPLLYVGQNYLFIHGEGAANATSGEMTGGIAVTLGEAARRLGTSTLCAPPNCQVAKLQIPPAAIDSNQTLKLYTPHRYRSATATLLVTHPTAPTGGGGRIVSIYGGGGAGTGSTPTPTRTPTPRAVRDQGYSASLGCPDTPSAFQNNPSQEFEVRSTQVQATAAANWLDSRATGNVPKCTYAEDFQFQFAIKGLSGQNDVAVSWRPTHTGNYSNPLSYSSGAQTITLSQGRWRIVPDATFPSDFTFTVSYRD